MRMLNLTKYVIPHWVTACDRFSAFLQFISLELKTFNLENSGLSRDIPARFPFISKAPSYNHVACNVALHAQKIM